MARGGRKLQGGGDEDRWRARRLAAGCWSPAADAVDVSGGTKRKKTRVSSVKMEGESLFIGRWT